jgi:hypothetical protein
MKAIKLLASLAILLLASCATVPLASPDADAAAKAFSPPNGKASVYIGRANSPIGGAISFQVIVDGKVVGSAAPGTYYLVEVDPGNHSVAATSNENSEKAKFAAYAGKNYYFEVSVNMGVATARVGLKQIQDEQKGQSMVRAAKRAEGLLD